jgi:hypothetical protein
MECRMTDRGEIILVRAVAMNSAGFANGGDFC